METGRFWTLFSQTRVSVDIGIEETYDCAFGNKTSANIYPHGVGFRSGQAEHIPSSGTVYLIKPEDRAVHIFRLLNLPSDAVFALVRVIERNQRSVRGYLRGVSNIMFAVIPVERSVVRGWVDRNRYTARRTVENPIIRGYKKTAPLSSS
jgi:hypothetical protein